MSLRVYFIFAILPVVAFMVFRQPIVGVCFLAVYNSWNPDLWSAPSFLRPEMIITVATLASLAINSKKLNNFKTNKIVITFFLFSMWLLYNSSNALYSQNIAYEFAFRIFKCVIVMFIFTWVIDNFSKIKLFYIWYIFGLLWLSKSIFYQYFIEHRLRVDPLGGTGGGGNAIVTELCMTLPFLLYFFFEKKGYLKLLAFSLLTIWFVDFIAIASRGGFLVLIIVLLLFFFKFDFKSKAIVFSTILLILAIMFVPTYFWERMDTITNYEKDASAMGRIHLWATGIEMAKSHPVFGVGTKNFQFLSKEFSDSEYIPEGGLVAHNNFIEIVAENGLPGFTLFVLGLVFALFAVRKAQKNLNPDTEKAYIAYCKMVEIALIAFILRGLTGTNYMSDAFYFFLGLSAAIHNFVNRSKLFNSVSTA